MKSTATKRASACWLFTTTACVLGALALAPSACDGSALATPTAGGEPPGSSGSSGEVDPDAAVAEDASPIDGTPTRLACTSSLGNGLSPEHGRLDGTLVSVVAPGERSCPSDASHLHLQIAMGGATYDIAVNIDGFEGEVEAPLPGIPFAEGWHAVELDYVRDLNLHAPALALTSPTAIRSRLEGLLASANHLSVFGTGYPGSDGAHLIHRNARNRDGALVINPLAPKARVIAFRFMNDTF
jgi:hypothetical protein